MNRTISKNLRFLVGLTLIFHAIIQADSRLVVNLTHLPATEISALKNELLKDPHNPLPNGETPGEISIQQIDALLKQQLMPELNGFRVVYAGYTTITDNKGLAIFPRRNPENKVYVAVTANFKTIRVKGETISHAEYTPEPNTPLKLYKCEKLLDEDKKDFWRVTKIKNPDKNRINPISVIIATHPNNVFIEEKDYMPYQGEQFVLPPIRIIGGQDNAATALKLLDLTHSYESVKYEQKPGKGPSVQKMITTT